MYPALLQIMFVLSLPVTVVRSVHRELLWRPGMAVKVVHRYGDVTIVGSARDNVVVDAVIRATSHDEQLASEFARGIEVPISTVGETMLVSTAYPDPPEPGSDISYEVNIELAVPSKSGLLVRNSFGNVTATGVGAGARLQNRFGDVELGDCRNCAVLNRFGNVRVSRSAGTLSVENSFGDVSLDSVTDRTTVENRYGNVQGSDMRGVVHLGNRLGTVSTRRCAGSLAVVNLYGDVSAWVEDSALTDLDVVSELGQVQLNMSRLFPFRLDGSTVQGDIRSGLPVEIEQAGERRLVSGALGQGGPAITLSGAWADFLIQPEPGGTGEGR